MNKIEIELTVYLDTTAEKPVKWQVKGRSDNDAFGWAASPAEAATAAAAQAAKFADIELSYRIASTEEFGVRLAALKKHAGI